MEERLLLGAHTSIKGGLEKSLLRGWRLGASTIQIFTKNSNRWQERDLCHSESVNFKAIRHYLKIGPVISHVGYLVNLASKEEIIREKSYHALVNEVKRCEILGIDYLVIHPGSHGGDGTYVGIQRIVRALDRLYEEIGEFKVAIVLETMAGQGTSIGSTFEEIAQIIEGVARPLELALCLDICHIFAAGYEVSTKNGYKELFEKIDTVIGLHKLKVIHLSDSKKECGSLVDRHEDIGKGMIGTTPFRWIMRDQRLKSIPKIIETPHDKENLSLLRTMASEERGDDKFEKSNN